MPDPEMFVDVRTARRRVPELADASEEDVRERVEEASQLILDLCPSAVDASDVTKRRVVLAMLTRASSSPVAGLGVTSVQEGAGPFQQTLQFANPTGDLYLTKAEKRQLGCGRQTAFEVDLLPPVVAPPGGP